MKAIEPLFSYKVNVFKSNKEAKDFETWYLKSEFVEDFSFEWVNDSDYGLVLEIMSMNPYFDVEALEAVYFHQVAKHKM